jgi:lipopolysaccharide/colanic/teichoic acid biosynthesis glycosyltransferase
VRRLARGLLYGGTAVVVLTLARFHAQYIGGYVFHSSSRLVWTVAYVALLCLAAYGVGLPDLARSAYAAMGAGLVAALSATLAISLAQLVVGAPVMPRFVIFWSVAFLIPGYAVCGFIAARDAHRGQQRDRVVAVVGSPEEADTLRAELLRSPERAAQLVALIAPAEARPASLWAEPLVDLAIDVDASVLVLDRQAQADERIVRQAAALHESGVRVRTLSLFYDEWLGKLPISELERVALMFDIGEVHRARYVRAKRLVDVGFALAGVVILAVLIPFVLVGNVIANRGRLLYRQPRTGRNGRQFDIIKLRTMRGVGAGTPSSWTEEADERVTPFGRVLRRTHLDELPQVLNILRGNLSIVGPRPEQPRYVGELGEKIPFYNFRHLVRPGLTGWAQVKYAYGASEFDAIEKLQYEFYYLRHQSVALDVRIIGRTVRSVVGRSGR